MVATDSGGFNWYRRVTWNLSVSAQLSPETVEVLRYHRWFSLNETESGYPPNQLYFDFDGYFEIFPHLRALTPINSFFKKTN